ncbi:hypothetical protein Aduo_009933 [Ancylostoma duodenale]
MYVYDFRLHPSNSNPPSTSAQFSTPLASSPPKPPDEPSLTKPATLVHVNGWCRLSSRVVIARVCRLLLDRLHCGQCPSRKALRILRSARGTPRLRGQLRVSPRVWGAEELLRVLRVEEEEAKE